MQNFTLGKKGISMLLFAFILLTSSFSAIAQNCPTVTNTTQDFCYLATVSDLEATANGDTVRWYRTAASTNPIPENELLQTGTYYAGNASGTCASRVPVSVTVDDAGAPEPRFGNIFAPCVYGESGADVKTVQDLIDNIEGFQVEIYEEQFSGNPLPSSTPLEIGESYYAGQRNEDTGCPTSRVAIRYDPVFAPAPTAEPVQTFCEGSATVADLEAQATSDYTQGFRWYSTATSQPPLASSTELIDGETYYVSQIVNRDDRNEPPCESRDRFAVTVVIDDSIAGEDNTETTFCRSDLPETFEVSDVEAFFRSLLSEDANPNGTFSNSTIEEITTQFNSGDGTGVFSTTYTVGEGECENSAFLSVTVFSSPEAGDDNTSTTFCRAELPESLTAEQVEAFFTSLLSDDAQPGGTFSPDAQTIADEFNNGTGLGVFSTTYTVVNDNCEDSAFLSVTVTDPDAGEDNTGTEFCRSALPATLTEEEVTNFFLSLLSDGATQGGTFSNQSMAEITADFNDRTSFPVTYSTTYTVGEGACEDTAFLSVTVLESPDSGLDNSATYCEAEVEARLASPTTDFEDLFEELLEDGVTGGSFSPTPVYSGPQTYTSTYTITLDNGCTDSAIITIIVEEDPNAGEDTDLVFCQNEFAALLANPALLRAELIELIGEDVDTNGVFTNDDVETIAGQYFAAVNANSFPFFAQTTYTVTNEAGCTSSSDLTLTVNPSPNAGDDGSVTVSKEDDQFNLFTILVGNPDSGGTWSPGNTDGSFNPATGESGVYTYTVTNEFECSDSATVTVTVTSDPTDCEGIAGPDNTSTVFCRSELNASYSAEEVEAFFRSLLSSDAQPGGTFSPSFADIADDFNSGSGVGVFSTTYTVEEGDCQDSATLSVTVNETVQATTGEIDDFAVCTSDTNYDLYSVLTDDNTPGGIFFYNSMEVMDGMFDISEAGNYLITYTVSENNPDTCVEGTASTEFTITVNEGNAVAGTPSTGIVCLADIATTFPTVEAATNYLLDLLDENVSRDGEFSSPMVQFFNELTGSGDYTITYTVIDGDCEDSVELTVRIVENANAGKDGSVTLNENDAPVNLFDYLGGEPMTGGTWSPGNGTFNPATDAPGVYTYTVGSESCQDSATITVTVTQDPTDCEGIAGEDNSIEVCNADVRNLNETSVRNLYIGLLDEGVPTNGSFNPSITQLIDQYNIVSNYGDFTTTYIVEEGDCSDSVVLTVTVIEANDAGADVNLTFCSTDEAVDLFDYLSPFATTNGSFTGYANGTFNPSTATIGVTTITYVVEDDNSICSTDNFTSTFTITVNDAQVANAGGNVEVSYCVDQNEDIQLSTLLGEGAIATGSFGAPYASGVFNPSTAGIGVYSITYTVAGDCITGTDTATLTVTVLGSPPAPVAAANQAFCLVNNPTVAQLVATGEGTLIWYSDANLTTVAPASTALTNNAVFYVVSSTGDSACETSDAVSVTVTLNTAVSPTVQTDGNEFCRQDNPTVADLIANLNGTAIRVYTSATGGTALATTVALVDGVTYYATSTNATTGCESSERRAINVEVGFCGIPEGFSPNGDGINDRFVIPDIAEDYPNYTIEVFNRWGNVVFKGNANTPDWDGVSNQSTTLGDKVLPAGVYFYIVNYNDGSTPPVQGKLYLSR